MLGYFLPFLEKTAMLPLRISMMWSVPTARLMSMPPRARARDSGGSGEAFTEAVEAAAGWDRGTAALRLLLDRGPAAGTSGAGGATMRGAGRLRLLVPGRRLLSRTVPPPPRAAGTLGCVRPRLAPRYFDGSLLFGVTLPRWMKYTTGFPGMLDCPMRRVARKGGRQRPAGAKGRRGVESGGSGRGGRGS